MESDELTDKQPSAIHAYAAADPMQAAMLAVRRRLDDGPAHFEEVITDCQGHERGDLRHAVDVLWAAKRIQGSDHPAPLGHQSFELVADWTPRYS